MNINQIYVIGEMLVLNELKIIEVSYPAEEIPSYLIAGLKEGFKLKIEIYSEASN